MRKFRQWSWPSGTKAPAYILSDITDVQQYCREVIRIDDYLRGNLCNVLKEDNGMCVVMNQDGGYHFRKYPEAISRGIEEEEDTHIPNEDKKTVDLNKALLTSAAILVDEVSWADGSGLSQKDVMEAVRSLEKLLGIYGLKVGDRR